MELINENKICNKEVMVTLTFMSEELGVLLYDVYIYIFFFQFYQLFNATN